MLFREQIFGFFCMYNNVGKKETKWGPIYFFKEAGLDFKIPIQITFISPGRSGYNLEEEQNV